MREQRPASESEYFATAQRRFEVVAQACSDQLHVRELDIAGAHVRLRLVGNGLAECVTETFAHLQAPPAPAALEIDAWSENETGEPALPQTLPWAGGFEGRIDGGSISISPDERFLAFRVGDNSVSWLDRSGPRIVASVRRPEDLLLRERVKPFGALMPLWLRDRGVRVVHAAAVAEGPRAVLIPGLSGAGKSTCATFCVEAGLDFLGDDAIALEEADDGRFIAHSLYGGARLWPADGGFFPDWSARAIHPYSTGDEAKLLMFVGRRHRERLRTRAQIAAIAFPKITASGESRLRPLARVEVLRALVITALFLVVKPEPADLDQMLRLATRLPAFQLELGTDRSQIPALIERCLQA